MTITCISTFHSRCSQFDEERSLAPSLAETAASVTESEMKP